MLAVIGTGELLVILGLVLVLFGGKKLPELAKNLGQGMREFKKACNGAEDEITEEKCCKDDKKPTPRGKCCQEKDNDKTDA